MNRIEKQIYRMKEEMLASGLDLSNTQIARFQKYISLLLEWNRRTNLISRKDEHNIVSRHIFESLAVLDMIPIPFESRVIDIGTGAGFPGIPLKIMREDLRMSLLDSKRMKTLFLREVASELNFNDLDIINERAEAASQSARYKRKYDIIFARAVSELINLYEWSNGFADSGARILAIKGGDLTEELSRFSERYSNVSVKLIPVTSPLVETERTLAIISF